MTKNALAKKYASLSFEEALNKLEEIIESLEKDNMTLDKAIGAYEEGAFLKQQCDKNLAQADMKVKAIVENEDGTLETKDMEQ